MPPEEQLQKKKKKKTQKIRGHLESTNGSMVEDEALLNYEKPLTVQALNLMFQAKQDIFEYPQERPDWKYPYMVRIERHKNQHQLNFYNDLNVTSHFVRETAMQGIYEEDDQYTARNQH